MRANSIHSQMVVLKVLAPQAIALVTYLKILKFIDKELCYAAQTGANVKDIASWVGNSSTIGRNISTPP